MDANGTLLPVVPETFFYPKKTAVKTLFIPVRAVDGGGNQCGGTLPINYSYWVSGTASVCCLCVAQWGVRPRLS